MNEKLIFGPALVVFGVLMIYALVMNDPNLAMRATLAAAAVGAIIGGAQLVWQAVLPKGSQ